MVGTIVCAAAIIATGPGPVPPDDALTVTASLVADTITPGETYRVNVTIAAASGIDATGAGLPNPILQIDVPECATLEGKVLKTQRELAGNEFLSAPYERVVPVGDSAFQFTLDRAPQAGETIGLNVVAYVATDDDAFFLRRRVELPLESGAVSRPVDARDASWGADDAGITVGNEAVEFSLPRADGTTVSLSDYLGKSNIIITTYRAFW